MRHRLLVATGLLLAWMGAPAALEPQEQALPVQDGRPAVASVGGEPIALDEFLLQLETPDAAAHLAAGRATASELGVLDRLITVRLLVQEAATMGLGELPEIRKQVDVASRQILRDVLMDQLVRDVTVDDAAVEEAFKALVREWRTTSVLFQTEEAASKAREAIAKGADYAEVAADAVARKLATADHDDGYHQAKDYLPAIVDALAKLDVGQVSPVIRIEAGFALVKVVDIRYPEDADAREEARQAVLAKRRQSALETHEQALRDQLVVVKKEVLDSLDYDAESPGMDALLADGRVVADIKGGNPVTVGDLTDYMRMQTFHGGDQPGRGKRLNARKQAALDATLTRRLLNMEALRLGIDRTHAYVDRLNAFEDGLVFNAFVQKVIVPESKMREEEVRTHYDQHRDDFAYPSMLKIRGLAYATRGAAESAVEKLRAGADYGWLATTSEGQVDKAAPGLLTFDAARPVATDSLPEGARKALADAKAGDVRLYASPEGHYYALAVQEVVAPGARPYDEVREAIAKKLYGEKLQRNVEAYAAKLRALSTVEVYLKKSE